MASQNVSSLRTEILSISEYFVLLTPSLVYSSYSINTDIKSHDLLIRQRITDVQNIKRSSEHNPLLDYEKWTEVRVAKTPLKVFQLMKKRKTWSASLLTPPLMLFQSHDLCPEPPAHDSFSFSHIHSFIQQISIECFLCFKNCPWNRVHIKSTGGPLSTIPKKLCVAIYRPSCWRLCKVVPQINHHPQLFPE